MTTRPITVGDTFWSISQSDEGGGSYAAPLRPWHGKVTRCYGGHDDAVALSRFDPETGEADTDSNATASLYPSELYDSEREAWIVYRGAVRLLIESLEIDLRAAAERLGELEANP
jgi:hypothetical protein